MCNSEKETLLIASRDAGQVKGEVRGDSRGALSAVSASTQGPPTPELCLAALVLGAQDLLVAGDHLAIVHIHDLGADLAVGGGHWGMRERRR